MIYLISFIIGCFIGIGIYIKLFKVTKGLKFAFILTLLSGVFTILFVQLIILMYSNLIATFLIIIFSVFFFLLGAGIGIKETEKKSKNILTLFELDNLTKDDYKKQYRLLARKYHPDVNNDKNDQEKFLQIKHSYEILIKK